MKDSSDFTIADMSAIVQAAISPLVAEMQSLKDKVDKLSQDRVTRTDIEKLRTELVGTMVPRDSYEARHSALIERDSQIESMVRDNRRDILDSRKGDTEYFLKYKSDIENAIQRANDKIETTQKMIDKKMKEQSEVNLSETDRKWIRLSQVIGYLAIAIAVIDFLAKYVKIGNP